jgi:hypothetical protein
MNIFTKIFHLIDKREKELLAVNNARKIYNAWKRWRSHSETSDERPLKIARSPYDSNHGFDPNKIARMPVTPLSEMKIARTPGRVEVLPSPVQVISPQISPPTHNPAPAQVIDVKPEKVDITKESAEQGKSFFDADESDLRRRRSLSSSDALFIQGEI